MKQNINFIYNQSNQLTYTFVLLNTLRYRKNILKKAIS